MKNLSIKKLFVLLVVGIALVFIFFSSLNYKEIKENRTTLLTEKVRNQALYVSKKITELNDKVAYEYSKYSDDLRKSEKIAQEYFKENGFDAPLAMLQKKLNNQKKDFKYDIYLINKDFVIDRTTYKKDLYLDFHLLPEALSVLRRVYKDAESIDISIPRNDPFSNTYKNYILQKMQGKEYLLQLSLTVQGLKTIQEFVKKLEKRVPNLLSSSIFNLYLHSSSKYNIEYEWKQGYHLQTNKKNIRSKDIYNEFMDFFNPEQSIKLEALQGELEKFISITEYKATFIEENGKYIYKVLVPYTAYLSIDEYGIYILALEFDETEFVDELNTLFYKFLLSWFAVFMVLAILLYLVNKRLIEPIVNLQSLMKEKKLVKSENIFNKKDEISSMSLIYNQLLNDLKREIQSNEILLEEFKTFTANSIHQARTPLSVIKIALEMIESDNKEAMMQIESSIVSIEHLYDTLSYSIISENLEFKVEELNLSDILKQRVSFFSVVAFSHDKEFFLDVRDGVNVSMNKEELEFLIDNNLSNALKYSPPNTKIEIHLKESSDEITLLFSSSGKIIEDKKVIFERYKRGDSSRKGTGLGLSIVNDICKKNKILIHVSSLDGVNEFSYFFSKSLYLST